MTPCYSCRTQPELINGVHGMHYQCPHCKVKARAWADEQAASEDWERANNPGLPAGLTLTWNL